MITVRLQCVSSLNTMNGQMIFIGDQHLLQWHFLQALFCQRYRVRTRTAVGFQVRVRVRFKRRWCVFFFFFFFFLLMWSFWSEMLYEVMCAALLKTARKKKNFTNILEKIKLYSYIYFTRALCRTTSFWLIVVSWICASPFSVYLLTSSKYRSIVLILRVLTTLLY